MKITTSILLLLLPIFGFSQYVKNPSFEGGQTGRTIGPPDWTVCDYRSSPDTEPCETEIGTAPSDGSRFITMVSRGNSGTVANSCEDIQADLLQPLLKGNCYDFSIDLKYSETFSLYAGMSVGWVYFQEPVILKFYGGNSSCETTELLYTTEPISNTEWKTFSFNIVPTSIDINHLILVVDYASLPTYNGNVQVDNLKLIPKASVTKLDTTLVCGRKIKLKASEGDSYQWTPSIGLDCSDCQTPNLEASNSDTYIVSIQDGACKYDEVFNLNVNPLDSDKDSLMVDTTLECINTIGLKASEGDSYSWTPALGLTCDNCQNPTAKLPYALEYTAIVTNGFCQHREFFKIDLDSNIMESNVIKLDTTLEYGTVLELDATEGDSYQWSPSIGLSCNNCQNPQANPPYQLIYTVTITKGSCSFSELFDINIKPIIPNVITPNGDEKNDIFYIDGLMANTQLTIVDRNGTQLFSTNNYENNWGGKVNNSLLPPGTYWYSLRNPDMNVEFTGFIHIMY